MSEQKLFDVLSNTFTYANKEYMIKHELVVFAFGGDISHANKFYKVRATFTYGGQPFKKGDYLTMEDPDEQTTNKQTR